MKLKFSLLLVMAALLTGCADMLVASPSVVGKYKGEAVPTSTVEPVRNIERGLAASASLDIRADKTFHMVAAVVPIDGKWEVEGDTLTLTPDKVLGFEGIKMQDGKIQFRVQKGQLEPVSKSVGNFRFVREASETDLP
jgi:hypothetical protein